LQAAVVLTLQQGFALQVVGHDTGPSKTAMPALCAG
jgi:hypothetical protein